jgi:hypothetical protein
MRVNHDSMLLFQHVRVPYIRNSQTRWNKLTKFLKDKHLPIFNNFYPHKQTTASIIHNMKNKEYELISYFQEMFLIIKV